MLRIKVELVNYYAICVCYEHQYYRTSIILSTAYFHDSSIIILYIASSHDFVLPPPGATSSLQLYFVHKYMVNALYNIKSEKDDNNTLLTVLCVRYPLR